MVADFAWSANDVVREPKNIGNWIGLGMCFVPGAGIPKCMAKIGAKLAIKRGLHQVTKNRIKGLAAEAAVRQRYIDDGYEGVQELHKYLNVGGRRRKHDFTYINADGKRVYVEVKSGNARYGGRQKAIDDILRSQGVLVEVVRFP